MGHQSQLYSPTEKLPDDAYAVLEAAISIPGILPEDEREHLAEASDALQRKIHSLNGKRANFGHAAAAELLWRLGQHLNRVK